MQNIPKFLHGNFGYPKVFTLAKIKQSHVLGKERSANLMPTAPSGADMRIARTATVMTMVPNLTSLVARERSL